MLDKRLLSFALVAVMSITVTGAFGQKHQGEALKGFTPLFNGENLKGWHGRPHVSPYKIEQWSDQKLKKKRAAWNESLRQHWRVEDGVIINDGKGPYLTTDEQYEDFVLLVDYKMSPDADSGIYLRSSPQVQIWNREVGSGGLYNNKNHASEPMTRADRKFGKWNHLRIKLVDNRATVHLNGKKVVDDTVMENFWNRDKKLRERGVIQLQTHGGEMRFRDVYIKPLNNGDQ